MSKKRMVRFPRLRDAELDRSLGAREYDRRLSRLQQKLRLIQQAYLGSGQSGVIVFEGWDAAGKGGTIRRMSSALDPRSFKVWSIGPPRNYYLERHYLLRFMERMPPRGALSVFDRSWYGRVLVERIEGLIPEQRWRAAYREINDFEHMLVDNGTRLVKLFFHISPQEQLRRFELRLSDPLKRWKLSYEDFRNRENWQGYSRAIDDMFERTSTDLAPWRLISANDKKFARVSALEAVVGTLGKGVSLDPPTLDDTVLDAARRHMPHRASLIDDLSGRTE